jgi:hypothetical protein
MVKNIRLCITWGISSGGEELATQFSSGDVISCSMKEHPVECSVFVSSELGNAQLKANYRHAALWVVSADLNGATVLTFS